MTGPVSQSPNDESRSDRLALLGGLGLMPPDGWGECSQLPVLNVLASADRGTDIQQSLVELWTEWRRVAPKRQRDHATKVAAWLQSVADGGGCFTCGASGEAGRRLSALCGPRVLFWPQGTLCESLAVVTTSRIGRSDSAIAAFVEKLGPVLPRIAESRRTVLVMQGTAGAELVYRAAQQASMPVLRGAASEDRHPERWLSRLMQADADGLTNERRVFVSPSIPAPASVTTGAGNGEIDGGSADALPLQDRVAVALASTVWNVSLRKGGNLDQLLTWRLQQDAAVPAAVRLVVPGNRPVPDHLKTLIDQGAVLWQWVNLEEQSPVSRGVRATGPGLPSESRGSMKPAAREQADLMEQLSVDGEWLIHWTRMRTGPHEGESSRQWLDRQLELSSDDPTGPLAALQQILRDGIIRASSAGLRGSKPMTCFSAVSLWELASRRRFQTHRARWDFEPYGLCIRRRALEQLGARPVIYGDDSLWQALPEPERPWFQQRFSGRSRRQIDWSEEREWRVAGNVVLAQLERDDVIVFCRESAEVGPLSDLSRRHVVACEWWRGQSHFW